MDNTTERKAIAIKVVDKSRADGSNGTARVGVQDTNGTWYSVFDVALWPRLETGAHLNVEVRNKGQYKNIVGILGTARTENGAAPTEGSRERRIQAECALRAAVDASRSWPQMDAASVVNDAILATADKFLTWLLLNEHPTEEPF